MNENFICTRWYEGTFSRNWTNKVMTMVCMISQSLQQKGGNRPHTQEESFSNCEIILRILKDVITFTV